MHLCAPPAEKGEMAPSYGRISPGGKPGRRPRRRRLSYGMITIASWNAGCNAEFLSSSKGGDAHASLPLHIGGIRLYSSSDGVEQTAFFNDILDKGRERLGLIGLAGGEILDHAGAEIHLHLTLRSTDILRRLVALQNRQPDIDGVSVEDAGEGGGDDAGNPARLDGDGGVFAGGRSRNFSPATIISPVCTLFTNSLSISSMQWAASALRGVEYRAGMITSVSTLSPYLCTCPVQSSDPRLSFLDSPAPPDRR